MFRRKVYGLLDEKGFTLLESMIALAILSGVVVAVLVSLNYNLGVAAYDRDLVAATVLGKEIAEESSLFAMAADSKGVFTGPFSKFSWSVHTGATEIEGLKRVNIKISWDSDKNVTFASFKREK